MQFTNNKIDNLLHISFYFPVLNFKRKTKTKSIKQTKNQGKILSLREQAPACGPG